MDAENQRSVEPVLLVIAAILRKKQRPVGAAAIRVIDGDLLETALSEAAGGERGEGEERERCVG